MKKLWTTRTGGIPLQDEFIIASVGAAHPEPHANFVAWSFLNHTNDM